MQQTGADGLTGMRGHNCASAVFVTQEVMAALGAEDREARLSERGNDFRPGYTQRRMTDGLPCPATAR